LRHVFARANNIGVLPPLGHLGALERLDVSRNVITQIGQLNEGSEGAAARIDTPAQSGNAMMSWPPRLQWLSLRHNRLDNTAVRALGSAVQLEWVSVTGNAGITDLLALSECRKLRSISAYLCTIAGTIPWSQLANAHPELEALAIANNPAVPDARSPEYRKQALDALPGLRWLDDEPVP
jgi:hypothetical protein